MREEDSNGICFDGSIDEVKIYGSGDVEYKTLEPEGGLFGEADFIKNMHKETKQREEIAKDLGCDPAEIKRFYNYFLDQSNIDDDKLEYELAEKATKVTFEKNLELTDLHLVKFLLDEGFDSLTKNGTTLIKISGTLQIDGDETAVLESEEASAFEKLLKDDTDFFSGMDFANGNTIKVSGGSFGGNNTTTAEDFTIHTGAVDNFAESSLKGKMVQE